VSQARTYAVRGMHCPACERIVADTLVEEGLATSASASLSRLAVTVEVAPGVDGEWLGRAGAVLAPMGYRLLEPGESARWAVRETLTGLGIAGAILALFVLLQVTGVVHVLTPSRLDAGGAFVLGVVASLSSCFALVGGLLVTYTSALARTDQKLAWAGQAVFHVSRVATFVLLGGALGALGSAFALDLGWTWALQAIAALIMILLGLQLLGAFTGLGVFAGFGIAGGAGVTARARRWAGSARVSSGAVLGLASFFLPCGFTQSMQFQALAAGSPAGGALLLGVFSLGTLPVLAGLSTALVKGFRGRGRELMAKTAGFLVLGLGLYQAGSLLIVSGLLRL
jgi:sulfite exporter TauE/SafE